MKRDLETHNFGIHKHKSHETHITFSIPNIKFGTSWNMINEQFGVDFIIGHYKILPFGIEEFFHRGVLLGIKFKNYGLGYFYRTKNINRCRKSNCKSTEIKVLPEI
jgi:hypothetical protein